MRTIAQLGKAKAGGRDGWPTNNSFPYLRGAYQEFGDIRDSADYLKQVRLQLDVRIIFSRYAEN